MIPILLTGLVATRSTQGNLRQLIVGTGRTPATSLTNPAVTTWTLLSTSSANVPIRAS